MNWMSFHLMKMPAMGGTSMRAKKMMIAAAYTPYFIALRDDSLSNVLVILSVNAPSAHQFRCAFPFFRTSGLYGFLVFSVDYIRSVFGM